jgi:hypothetical protein
MLGWLEQRGWSFEDDPDDPEVVCAELPLGAATLPEWREAA